MVLALVLPAWSIAAEAGDHRPVTPDVGTAPEDWGWLDRWWVEPELEWDSDEERGLDFSVDAEIGHMFTDRLGFWSRPAYHTDRDEQTEGWALQFGIRYRFD